MGGSAGGAGGCGELGGCGDGEEGGVGGWRRKSLRTSGFRSNIQVEATHFNMTQIKIRLDEIYHVEIVLFHLFLISVQYDMYIIIQFSYINSEFQFCYYSTIIL